MTCNQYLRTTMEIREITFSFLCYPWYWLASHRTFSVCLIWPCMLSYTFVLFYVRANLWYQIKLTYLLIPPFYSSKEVVIYRRKYGHSILVNRLGSLPRNSVNRLNGQLDRTLVVDWVIKPQYKQKKKKKRRIWSDWSYSSLGAQIIVFQPIFVFH